MALKIKSPTSPVVSGSWTRIWSNEMAPSCGILPFLLLINWRSSWTATVNYEITDRQSEMSMTWREYIDTMLKQVNDRHAKQILLYLSKHNDRFWRPGEIKKDLNLELSEDDILRKLITLAEADFLERGISDIQFKGLTDGTLNMVLRNRFEEEIFGFVPDLKKEFHQEITELKKDKSGLPEASIISLINCFFSKNNSESAIHSLLWTTESYFLKIFLINNNCFAINPTSIWQLFVIS